MGLNSTLTGAGWVVELDSYGSQLTPEQIAGQATGVAGMSDRGDIVYGKSSLMTRCITGRANAVATSSLIWTGSALVTGLTQHQRHVLATHFDAVRIAIPNMHTSTVAGVKVAFGVSTSLGAYSSAPTTNSGTGTTSASPAPTETVSSALGVWRQALFNGATSATLPVAVDAANIYPSWTWTDWTQIASVDRTDGGTLPVLDLRIFIPVAAGSITTGWTGGTNQAWSIWGRDDLITGGRVCRVWNQDVDGIATPASFTTTTTYGVMIPIMLQYMSRSTGATILVLADSIGEASTGGTYTNNSFVWQAALGHNSPVEVCNYGFAGGSSIQVTQRVQPMIDQIQPTHILGVASSTNNFGTTLGARVSGETGGTIGVLAAMAKRVDAQLGLYEFLAVTNAAKAYAATDSFRVAGNTLAETRAGQIGARWVDLGAIWDGSAHASGQIEPSASLVNADGVHPNDAGHVAFKTPVASWLSATVA